MDNYFIKAFIKDDFIGINGIHEVIEHFSRPGQEIHTLIYVIIKADKSLEDWTISTRLGDIKSPFKYGLSEHDISLMNFDEQIELLQYYCNIYILLYHICKSTENRLDKNYNEHLDLNQLNDGGGDGLNGYIEECNKKCLDKWNRGLL